MAMETSMQCPRCQHINPPDTAFCGDCGARLESLCPACRAVNPVENRFCGKCGQPLAAPSGAERRPPIDAGPTARVGGQPAPAGRGPTGARFDSPAAYTPKHLAEKILTSRSAIEGERKQVSVLFTD